MEDALRPFQAASQKFLQASYLVQEAGAKDCAQAWMALQDEVRRAEQDGYQAAMAATRKQLESLGQVTGSPEELYAARVRAQLEYEREIRQIYADTQTKLTAAARKASEEATSGRTIQRLSSQRQEAYQAYLGDLQQAWSGTQALDPQTMNAIALSMLFTINAAIQGS